MRYFGNTPAYDEALGLENAARAGDFAVSYAALDRLDAAVDQIVCNMREYLQTEMSVCAATLPSANHVQGIT